MSYEEFDEAIRSRIAELIEAAQNGFDIDTGELRELEAMLARRT